MKEVKKVYSLPVAEIIIPEDRIRKEFEMKKLRNLAMSFQTRGQKQPGVCRREGEKIILVAGERRLKACEMLGIEYLFTLDEVGEDNTYEIKKIELEENICRVDLSWQEKVAAIEQLHRIEQEEKGVAQVGVRGGHSIKDTAKIVEESVGSVSEDLKLAIFAKSSKEVREAKTKGEAKKIIKRLEEKMERYERFEKTLEEAKEEEGGDKEVKVTSEEQMIFFAKKIHLSKMEDKLKDWEDGWFDVVCFDPPWRVGIDSVRKKGGGTDDFEDTELESEDFREELTGWLQAIHAKMAENSHLYLFFGIVRHNLVYRLLSEAGFTTNKIPLIWHKQGAHVVRTPDVWPGRSYEPIAFARKGNKNLVRKGAPDVIPTPAPTPSMKKNHPTAKHPSIYLELLQRSCLPGDKVLDPMCGSGMFGVAADALEPSLKLKWEMIEEKADFRRLAILNVVDGFSSIVQRQEPLEPPESPYTDKLEKSVEEARGFKNLKIGSEEWKFYWNEHKDEQDEMIAWRKEKK